jgi:nucleotide-binding universal stress UspA family protein
MTVVCGTDFSAGAAQASQAAAALAARLDVPLHLVHVLDGFWGEISEGVQIPLLDEVRGRLHAEADGLRRLGVTVQQKVLHGAADEALVAYAQEAAARLIVVSSVGRRAPDRWLLGSVAERTAQTSRIPVLVVRDAAPFQGWADGKQHLRVMVAADFSSSADAAIRWVAELGTIGPCDVIAAYSSWPPEERRRLGTGIRRTVFENDPEIDAVLRRDLQRKVDAVLGAGGARIRVESCLGRTATHLVDMAREERADVLVVGTHQRHGARRLWHGSVSRGVLHDAPMSVACVPAVTGAEAEARIPEIRSVLAATDFSEPGNRAIAFAYALLPQQSTVHLVHVVEMAQVNALCYRYYETGFPPTAEQRALQEPELTAQLEALIPEGAAARGIDSRAHVIEARDAAAAIGMAAERLSADLICLGSHGRSGLSTAFAGSVTQQVIAGSGRPVLVVGPRRG